jgi:Na+/melibiose symporter-like transporter
MTPAPHARLGAWDGLRYGALAAPLAFAALPLYVHLPEHYASRLGVPLAGLGAVLLATRLADAVVDPWLGRLADRLLARSRQHALAIAWLAALALATGLAALFFPPRVDPPRLLAWCAAGLLVTCLGYSGLSVLHQAWGSRLGGDAPLQARIAGWREGLALAGVITASLLPALAGIGALVIACALGLVLALLALASAPAALAPAPGARASRGPADPVRRPWRQRPFRRLIAIFVLNGLAAAVPATLLLFYVRDRLQAPGWEGLFLGSYFVAAALSLPWWVRLAARRGLASVWLTGMGLAVAGFVWAALLGPGQAVAFVGVCVATGLALGADLVAAPALLTGVIQRAGDDRGCEGAYVGWWTCAAKLNLALAAGLALPALQGLGYAPGTRDEAGLAALVICYAALPCGLKLAAAVLLWRSRALFETPSP